MKSELETLKGKEIYDEIEYYVKGFEPGEVDDKVESLLSTEYVLKSEADKVIAKLKAREDVLCTDNRDLLEKVKMLEERLHENAEHYKRNEEQILESSDNEIKKLKAENEDIDYQRKQLSRVCAIKENEIKELIDNVHNLKVIISQKEDSINELVDKEFNIKKDEIISNANKKFEEFTDALCRKVLKSKNELTVAVQDAQQDFYDKFIAGGIYK